MEDNQNFPGKRLMLTMLNYGEMFWELVLGEW